MRLVLRASFVIMVFILLLIDVQMSSASIPSRQSKTILFTNVTSSSMTVSWTRGNGSGGVLVLVRPGDSPPDVSSLGDNYNLLVTENNNYSAASELYSGSGRLVGKGNISTLNVSGLASNTKYQVMVVEYNVDGSYLDINNNTANLNPRDKKTLAVALNPPTSLNITAQTATTVTINWTDAPGAVGYELDVQYNNDFIAGWDPMDIGDNASNLFLIFNLPHASDGGYRFRMRSYDAGGNKSDASSWVTFATLATDPVISTSGTSSTCGLTFTLSASYTSTGYSPANTGTWTVVSKPSGATAGFSNENSKTPVVTVSAYGEYTFKYRIVVGLYEDAENSTITFTTAPTANAGSDASYCNANRLYALSGSTLTGGQTGTWTFVSSTPPGGSATFSNANSPTSNAWANQNGAFTFRWTVSNGACTANDDVVITYSGAVTTATAGPDGSKCGLTSYQLAGNLAGGGETGVWSKTGGPGTATFSAPGSGTSFVSVSSQGTYTFQWKITNGTCSSSDEVSVVFYNTPTTATVGNPGIVTTCGYTLALDGNTPSVGIGTWTKVSGPGTATFSDMNSPTSSVTVDLAGSWSFAWTIGNGASCTSSAGKQITFLGDPTTANAGSDGQACGVSYTLQGNTATSGTGTWTKVSGAGTPTFTAPNSGTSLVTIPSFSGNSTTYTLKWAISNGTCSTSDNVDITFYNAPTTASAGSDGSNCGLTGYSLSGNNPTVGTGTWTKQSGPGTATFGSPNSGCSTAGVSQAGTYTFRWTIGNGNCSNSYDDVQVVYNAAPTTASAGADNDACGMTYTLQGNVPTNGTGSWTQTAGTGTASFGTSTSATSLVTVPSFGGNSASFTFRWTISNGTCPPSTDDVTITFWKTPTTANAGSNNSTCGLAYTLQGNTPTVGTGSWTKVSGDGTPTFGTVTSPTSGVTIPTFSGNSTSYTFAWTITNGPSCTPSTSNVTITFYNTPTTASAGADNTTCTDTYTLTGNIPTYGTGTWSQITGTGASFTNANLGTTNVTFSTPGVYHLRWTIGNGPSCGTTFDDVDITYYAAPTTADAGSNNSACGLTYTLMGNTPTVGTGSWTKVSGDGTPTFGTTTTPHAGVTIPSFSGSSKQYTFRWSISNGTCTPSTSDVVITFYNNPSTASAGVDNSTCTNTYTLAGNTPTAGTGTWSKVTGPGTAVFDNANAGNTNVTFSSIGTYTLRWTIGNGVCSTNSDDVAIQYYNLTANAGNDAYGCYPQYTLSANNPSPATGSWTVVSGPGTATFGNTTSPTSTVNVSALGIYNLRWNVTSGTCSASDEVAINFVERPDFGSDGITGAQIVSIGTTNVQYSVPSHDNIVSYTWTYTSANVNIQGTGTNTYTGGNVITMDFGLTATTGTLSVTGNGLCASGNTIWIPITVTDRPVIMSSVLDATTPNAFLEILTSQDVYTNNNGTGDLTPSDFNLIFTKNSGTATAATISSVTKVDLRHWRLNLSITGTPNGCETIEAKPYEDQVWNWIGSVAKSMQEQTSGSKSLYNQLQPTIAASSFNITNVTSSQMDLSWTNGNGSKRIVVATKNASVVAPNDFTDYAADAVFGLGSTTAANNFVVYNGNGSSVTVTGLTGGTGYHFAIFEYDQACGTANYTATGTTSSATTINAATKLVITSAPTLIVHGVAFSVTVKTVDDNGNDVNPLCDEVITLSAPSGTFINNQEVITPTGSNSVTFTGIAYNLPAGGVNVLFTANDAGAGDPNQCGIDLTAATFTADVRPADPTDHANTIKTAGADASSISVYWKHGTGNGRAVIVRKSSTVPVDALSDGQDISAASTNNSSPIGLTSGIDLGSTKGYVVYRTDGSSDAANAVTVNGLEAHTNYSFRVTEYNYASATKWTTYNYKTVGTASLNPSTKSTLGKFGSFNGVEISDFNGRSFDAKAELNWEATREDGITGYEIYRRNSEVSDEFVKIGALDIKTAVGGSNIYKLIDNDNSLITGKEYDYKLVTVGFNGERNDISELSLTILSMPNDNVSLYVSEVNPNPVKDVVRFNVQTVKSAPVLVEIRNTIGQVIFTEERTVNGIQNFEYGMTAKAAGTYIITVTSGSEAAFTTFVFVP